MKRTTVLLSLMAMAIINHSASAQSAVPELINYQGYVTDSAGNPLGSGSPANLDVDFKFWATAVAGVQPLYSERQTVTINEGSFSVLIGNGDPIPEVTNFYSTLSEVFSQQDVFLGITVDKDNNGLLDDAEVSPRQQIATTAFAFRAKVAESVDNLAITEDMLAGSAITTSKISDGSITTEKLVVNSVTSSSIDDGGINTIDLADNSVTTAKIQADAVTSAKIKDGEVTGADIKDNTITNLDVANYSLTNLNYAPASATRYTAGNGVVQTRANTELLLLRGTFNGSASTIASTGLTAVRLGTGYYRVDFAEAFVSTPTVVVSSNGNSTTYYDNIVSVGFSTNTYCTVWVTDGGSNGGARQDGGFDVIAVGVGSY